jgi:hypothetical protein
MDKLSEVPVFALSEVESFDPLVVPATVDPVSVFGVFCIKNTRKITAIKKIIIKTIKQPLVLFISKYASSQK